MHLNEFSIEPIFDCLPTMTTLFVSDVHLSSTRPTITDTFLDFLRDQARKADALYILGDLFDEWLGDDDARDPYPAVESGLRDLTALVPVFIMHGNHDFLLGEDFTARTGCTWLPEPAVIELDDEKALLMHGDALCTQDIGYQQLRSVVRDPQFQANFLARPLQERRQYVAELREKSSQAVILKPSDITDVTQEEVDRLLDTYDLTTLIHGHTHRPKIHTWMRNQRQFRRIVTGDWYQQDSLLVWDQDGFRLYHGGDRI